MKLRRALNILILLSIFLVGCSEVETNNETLSPNQISQNLFRVYGYTDKNNIKHDFLYNEFDMAFQDFDTNREHGNSRCIWDFKIVNKEDIQKKYIDIEVFLEGTEELYFYKIDKGYNGAGDTYTIVAALKVICKKDGNKFLCSFFYNDMPCF